jgi:predicted HTH transcriptional regulator
MKNFDEYIRQGEPSRVEKARNWQTAIGLQDVDGLKPSAYLIEQAKLNIEGEITIDEVKRRIDNYYKYNKEQPEYIIDSSLEHSERCLKNDIFMLLNKHKNITTNEIANITNKSIRFVEETIGELINEGTLICEGARKNGYWKIIENEK